MPQKPMPLIISLKRWREQNGFSQSDAVKGKRLTNYMVDEDARLELWYAPPVVVPAALQAPSYNPDHKKEHLESLNRIISAVISVSALVFVIFLPREEAVAQTAKDLLGTWVFVSLTLEQVARRPIIMVPIRRAKWCSILTATFRQ
jgi:hypothetical protein